MSKGIKVSAKTFRDVITITLDNMVVDLEVKSVRDINASEDAEDPYAQTNAITAIVRSDDKDRSAAGRKLKQAKDKVVGAAGKIADKIAQAASR